MYIIATRQIKHASYTTFTIVINDSKNTLADRFCAKQKRHICANLLLDVSQKEKILHSTIVKKSH